MCTGILIAGMIASVVVAGASAMQQSSMAKAQAKFQQKVAQNEALDARQQADVAEDEKRRAIAQTIGSARARQAANGLLVNDTADSTNVSLIDDLIVAGELDILRIRDNGERKARGMDTQAELFKSQAANEKPLLAGGSAALAQGVSSYASYKAL